MLSLTSLILVNFDIYQIHWIFRFQKSSQNNNRLQHNCLKDQINLIDKNRPFSSKAARAPHMKPKALRQLALEHLSDGKSTAETASMLRVTQRTVQNWKKSEPIYGSGIVSRLHPRRLTPEQEAELYKFVDTRPGIVYEELVVYALEQFSEVISVQTAARILKRNNYTRKRSTRVNIH